MLDFSFYVLISFSDHYNAKQSVQNKNVVSDIEKNLVLCIDNR